MDFNLEVITTSEFIPIEPPSLFTQRRYRLLCALVLAFACAGGYAATSLYNISHVLQHPINPIQACAWDRKIPFVPGWVWVYFLYYPFCFLPLFLPEVREDPDRFTRTVLGFALQFAVGFGFFIFWPLRMEHVAIAGGLQGQILNQLYACDLGFNSFPSLHLANIVFVSMLFLRLRRRPWGYLISGVAVLIALSTVLIKQHFLSDVAAGAFLGWASFALCEGWNNGH